MNEMRKKKLLMEYKNRKTEMGIFVFECTHTGKQYIGYTNDTKSTINSNRFKLGSGMHSIKNLQNDWKNYGESNFSIRVLEVLPYDKDDTTKTDYKVELEILRDKWISKLEGSESM